MFHEYGHYLQNYGPMKHIETSVSEASVVGNKAYYISNWNRLPHEIAAEMAGVSLSWDAMSSMFPEQADGCMLEYVNFRARNTAYMLPVKDGGYASREEIEDSFALSLESSLSEPRRGDSGLQRMSNEAAALLKQGHANYKLSPNGRHFDMLISDVPGSKKDRLLAALAIHLHPDILDDHPELQDEDLTVEHEFGFPLAVETLPGPDMKSGPITELEQSVSKTDEREAETIRRRMFAERMDKGF